MYWVKLTTPEGEAVYINLDRFDTITRSKDDTLTMIRSTLSQTEHDEVVIEVDERPDGFVPLMETE